MPERNLKRIQQRREAILNTMRGVNRIINHLDLPRQRRAQDSIALLVRPPRHVSYVHNEVQGIPCCMITPHNLHSTDRVILCCHGGAFIAGSLKYAKIMAAKIAEATGLKSMAFAYRLAPEHPYPAALEDALAIFEHLIAQGYKPENIFVAGESAGGNLAVELALMRKERELPLPGRLICMSPWADLTASGKSYYQLKDVDATLDKTSLQEAAKQYAADMPLANPHISPIFANFGGFPPTLIHAGGHEILLSDAQTLCERMCTAGVDCHIHVFEGLCHVFQLYPFPESKESFLEIADFLQK